MAGKKLDSIKMFGDANFTIGEEVYSYRDGESVTPKNAEHAKLLEAENERRKTLYAILNVYKG